MGLASVQSSPTYLSPLLAFPPTYLSPLLTFLAYLPFSPRAQAQAHHLRTIPPLRPLAKTPTYTRSSAPEPVPTCSSPSLSASASAAAKQAGHNFGLASAETEGILPPSPPPNPRSPSMTWTRIVRSEKSRKRRSRASVRWLMRPRVCRVCGRGWIVMFQVRRRTSGG